MLGVVNLNALCGNQPDATAVSDAVATYLAGLPAVTQNRSGLRVMNKGANYWIVAVEVGYADKQQAINVFDRVQVLWNGAQFGPKTLAGSWVRWHECRADEGVTDCSAAPGGFASK